MQLLLERMTPFLGLPSHGRKSGIRQHACTLLVNPLRECQASVPVPVESNSFQPRRRPIVRTQRFADGLQNSRLSDTRRAAQPHDVLFPPISSSLDPILHHLLSCLASAGMTFRRGESLFGV